MSLATLPTTLFGTPLVSSVLDEIQGHVRAFLERHIIDEGLNYEAGGRVPTMTQLVGRGQVWHLCRPRHQYAHLLSRPELVR